MIMFSKATLTFLVVGALSVNALTVPVARSPTPEPEREFPRSLFITSHHDLTLSLLQQPKNSGPGCSSVMFHTTYFHVSPKLWTSCSRVSPRIGSSWRSAEIT